MKISVMKGKDVMSVIAFADKTIAAQFYWDLSRKMKHEGSELSLETNHRSLS